MADSTKRRSWAWLRVALGIGVLAALVVRIGAGPFLDGLRLTSTPALLAALAITAGTTVCCAWRWRLVADRLGVRLGLAPAIAAVYRAQFLNSTLPGGVLGDVHRAVVHGREAQSLSHGVRSVVWERTLGQAVQVTTTVVIVLALPSPLPGRGVAAAAVGVVVLLSLVLLLPGRSWPARRLRAVRRDLRDIARHRRAFAGIVLASAAITVGHALVFLVAAHAAGSTASPGQLLPLVGLVLLASAVPLNVAGWGPREGVAAWAFGGAGLGVDAGVTTAVVYGVMALVATLPGAVVLLAGRRWSPRLPAATLSVPVPEAARG